jgi:serine/threonine protein kinase
MSERCPHCQVVVVDNGVAPGGMLRCDKCGNRFPKAKRVVATAGLGGTDGIHPVLAARRYEALPAAPKPVAGDTRVLAGRAVVSADGTGHEPHTSPGRPTARRSYDGLAGTPPPSVKAPRAEEPLPRIPGYDVEAMIGKGAMGRVYRARHRSTGRMAAIKTLAPELALRPDFVARFEREGAAMRAVRHPGVVQVWDQGKTENTTEASEISDIYYIAMEFIEGPPLRKFLDQGALQPALALRWTRLILQALQAAHTPGVIHRDLKPENILMRGATGDERPVLVDFGLAGIMAEENDPHPNLTKSRMTMGTVNYMAPEQRTDAKRVDQRADVYAAGVIFYEFLTGDLPLGRFNLPRERGLNVPARIDEVVATALARKPEERFQSAADFDRALALIEAELPAPSSSSNNDTLIGPADGSVRSDAYEVPTTPPKLHRPVHRSASDPALIDNRSLAPSTVGASASSGLDSMMGSFVSAMPSSMLGSVVGSIAASMPGTFVEGLGPAWSTMLPRVQPRFIAATVATLVGVGFGLALLRAF